MMKSFLFVTLILVGINNVAFAKTKKKVSAKNVSNTVADTQGVEPVSEPTANNTNVETPQVSIGSEGQAKFSFGLEISTAPTYGFYFSTSSRDKFGVYFDIKSSFKAPADKDVYGFTKSYAISTLHDSQIENRINYTAINVGAIHSIHKNVSAFSTLGFVSKTEYLGFHDATGILGTNNTYYIKDLEKNLLNASVGFLIFVEKINFKVQYETGLKSTSFGIGGFF